MDGEEITTEVPRRNGAVAATAALREMLMVPALTSIATACFTLGGIWVAFGNVQAQAEDNADAIGRVADSVEAAAENLRDHEAAGAHAVSMDRWDTTDKRLTRIENEDRRQSYNIVAICTVTGAACDLAVTP